MRATLILPLIFTSAIATLCAQGPFQFREAYLLEHRIQNARSGEEYDPTHQEQVMALEGPGPANQFVADRNNPQVYGTERWKELLDDTDRFRRMGGIELAGRQYLDMVNGLRKAQGPASNDLALMLDHLGEFYLEVRNFDQAYKAFSEALEVRRATVAWLPPASPTQNPNALEAGPRPAFRLHLADLQTRLGQLDLAKADLASANQRLTEAISIFDEATYRRFVGGLYAIYFQSLVLEKQQKFQEAENLWRNEVKLREKLFLSDPYWNAQKEMAAFYARRGDFHTAAQIVQQIQTGVAGKTLHPELPMPYLDSRPRAVTNQPQYSLYTLESDTAMSEILAVDKWRTDGPDAAAALLKDPFNNSNNRILDRGSDAERTELLAWFERRVWLHMSMLLDGDPSQDRIDKAYALLSQIKGRYLSSITQVTQLVESQRGNPDTQIAQFAILDQLAKARESQAHLFLSAALDGKQPDALEFAARENAVRVISTALLAGPQGLYNNYNPSAAVIAKSVPASTAFIDIVAWDRTDRDATIPPHREYGAFVLRSGQPARFVRIGTVESIDKDIDAVHLGVMSNRERGFSTVNQTQTLTPEELQKRLRSLYQKVIAPLDASLQGATQLYVEPDGKLTVAPISAFVDAGSHYLFESRTVTYVGSWRDLTTAVYFRRTEPTAPIIVANPDFDLTFHPPPLAANAHRPVFKPLPGAEAEAEDVAKTLAMPADRVLTEKAARKSLIQSLESPDILHFATHSVPHLDWIPPATQYTLFEFPQPMDTQYPLLQSVIALAGANRPQQGPEDGLLTGLEVSSLHLEGTRLVVLSSCESGQGALVDGQGVLGLRAAFTMAGTQALVMTLWPVDDVAGRQFMRFFYSHLGKGAAEAVRLAQLDMLATTQYKNPFFWSGYVASASPVRELMQKPDRKSATQAAPIPPKPESFVAPTCFDFSAKDSTQGAYVNISDIRLKIGGIVHRTQPSPQQAVYDLTAPGNELEVRESTSVNGGPPTINPEIVVASERHWAVDLIVDKQEDKSSLSIRFGPARQAPGERRFIRLTGAPNLFPSFAIPDALPPISTYTQAIYSYGGNAAVTRAGLCTSAP